MGLSPDAPEDEAGIKKAAENSKAPAPPAPTPPGKRWAVPPSALLLGPLQQLPPSHSPPTPPPSKGLD